MASERLNCIIEYCTIVKTFWAAVHTSLYYGKRGIGQSKRNVWGKGSTSVFVITTVNQHCKFGIWNKDEGLYSRSKAEYRSTFEIGYQVGEICHNRILNGLPDDYRYLVVNLESQIQSISYEDLIAQLIEEEKRIIVEVLPSLLVESDPDIAKVHTADRQRRRSTKYFWCRNYGYIAREYSGE